MGNTWAVLPQNWTVKKQSATAGKSLLLGQETPSVMVTARSGAPKARFRIRIRGVYTSLVEENYEFSESRMAGRGVRATSEPTRRA
ncbi:hypothetical protein Adu01nite_83260 [Paractinoplanes durhamensis]|uniref:Uncharacterized protein n=1 Tax=Paractinoplanes durhamensis TaxID=113563 RepID=A0ABQ3ZAZ0_9ACTN|nr:hypothetical protein Adu01nite_83260 [Actinoplanes durhamensis]